MAADNAAAADVDVLVTIFHACHRQLSGAEAHYPFAVKNFTDLLAEAMGAGGRHDYYKQYKRGGEMDEALAAARAYLETNGASRSTRRRCRRSPPRSSPRTAWPARARRFSRRSRRWRRKASGSFLEIQLF